MILLSVLLTQSAAAGMWLVDDYDYDVDAVAPIAWVSAYVHGKSWSRCTYYQMVSFGGRGWYYAPLFVDHRYGHRHVAWPNRYPKHALSIHKLFLKSWFFINYKLIAKARIDLISCPGS